MVADGPAAIDEKWKALGGPTGSYGAALAPAVCELAADGCKRDFAGGSIYWTSATGAVAVWNGAIGGQWKRLGAESSWLKYPVSSESCGLPGGGCSQAFQSGTFYWSAANGAVPLSGGIGLRWSQIGGAAGRLGYPAGAMTCGLVEGGCLQHFERGSIAWSASAGAWDVGGAIAPRWAELAGQNGGLGYPVGGELCGLSGNGCSQNFQRGTMMWSPGTGAQPTWGGIRTRWVELGSEKSGLGYPTGREVCGLTRSGCYQGFQRGAMMWSAGTGAQPTWGAIRTRWAELGFENSWLGYPTGREVCGLPGDGCSQDFERATIFWSPSTGAQPAGGAIRVYYNQRGNGASTLGYPNSPEYCSAAGCRQYYQWGWLDWEPDGRVTLHVTPVGYCEAINRGGLRYDTAGAKRVSFAIAERYSSTPVTFATCLKGDSGYHLEWNVPGYAGESGFAWAGVATGPTINKYSPTGSFTVSDAFGLGNPGTALNYITLNSYSRWGGRLNGNYNKYFESSADVFPDENMWYYATRPSHDYRQGVVINYNRPPDSPIVMNAGFAIFLHANRVPTWGCISLLESDVTRFIRSAVPGDRIVMGVGGDVFR
ncbi:uncharacterized protein with LGFP repeats/L,D-peptidoglycan transpeptidase YkuD (ErfK/YbiS/YcfS/YnhG family) [Arthrobacter sp. B3I4]|nr:uncharacterized protein with LGFP repeats/L,D-peptidoglycan transpeptidase YkuD (ErfK/YbiS/YcfS/YnhG family) [Arthrobacter sp. B3I4]